MPINLLCKAMCLQFNERSTQSSIIPWNLSESFGQKPLHISLDDALGDDVEERKKK